MRLALVVAILMAVSAPAQEVPSDEQGPEFTVIDILPIKDMSSSLFTATAVPAAQTPKRTSTTALWVDTGIWRDTWRNPFAGRPAATASHPFVQVQVYRHSWYASVSGVKDPVLGFTYGVGSLGPVKMGVTLHGAQVFREDSLIANQDMRLSVERQLRWIDGGVDAGIGDYGGRNGHLALVIGYVENNYDSRLVTATANDHEPLSYDRSTFTGLRASGQWVIPGSHTVTIQGSACYLRLLTTAHSPFLPANELSGTVSARVTVWRGLALTVRGGITSEYAVSLLNDRSVQVTISLRLK